MDQDEPAFNFLKRETETDYPLLRIARIIQSILPSPANAERAFSQAQFLSEKRKNRLSMQSIKLRLQCLSD